MGHIPRGEFSQQRMSPLMTVQVRLWSMKEFCLSAVRKKSRAHSVKSLTLSEPQHFEVTLIFFLGVERKQQVPQQHFGAE